MLDKSRFESSKSEALKKIEPNQRPFAPINLLMMAGCLGLILIGFLLMTGSGSTVDGGFNPDIFSTRRIVIGPTVAFLGFLLMAFAILYNPDRRRNRKHNN